MDVAERRVLDVDHLPGARVLAASPVAEHVLVLERLQTARREAVLRLLDGRTLAEHWRAPPPPDTHGAANAWFSRDRQTVLVAAAGGGLTGPPITDLTLLATATGERLATARYTGHVLDHLPSRLIVVNLVG